MKANLVTWSVSDKNIFHLNVSRKLKFNHIWSAAFILTLEDISDPPHEASTVNGTVTVKKDAVTTFEVNNLISLCEVFIML
jgi:hypothetical protein